MYAVYTALREAAGKTKLYSSLVYTMARAAQLSSTQYNFICAVTGIVTVYGSIGMEISK